MTNIILLYSIEGEYVPMPGDEVKYRLCIIPPKYEKHQAVHVQIIHFSEEKHKKWEDTCNEVTLNPTILNLMCSNRFIHVGISGVLA